MYIFMCIPTQIAGASIICLYSENNAIIKNYVQLIQNI